jgi:rubrerythrin
MRPLRCQLCGETYLGEQVTDRCPYCGALGRQLVEAAEWVDYGRLDLSPEDQQETRTALGFEIANTTFYRAAAKKAETVFTAAIFKRLAKHELEHAELLARALGEELPDFKEEECPDSDRDKFAEANLRETRAIKHYLYVAARAGSPRLREVFRALAEIETQHLQVSNLYR